ncbi:MAG: hypothetical protein LBK70_02960 [Clostridiales bacterium]|jgi:hypothetical protein|nr:hypothetical protein [Clostridiales bacterium]
MQDKKNKSRQGVIGAIMAISLVLVLTLAIMLSNAEGLIVEHGKAASNVAYFKSSYSVQTYGVAKSDTDQEGNIEETVDPEDNGNIGNIYNPGNQLVITSHPKSQDYTLGQGDLKLHIAHNWTNGQPNRMSWLWYISINGSQDFRALNPVVVPSATASTLVFPAKYLVDATVAFRVRIQGQGTQGASVNILSNIATINIVEGVASRPIFETQPKSALVNVNSTHTLTATATANGQLAYQWYSNTKNTTDGAMEIGGQTTDSLVVDTSRVGTNYYFVKAINTVIDNGETFVATTDSDIAKIDVANQPNAPIITDQSKDTVVLVGAEVQLFVNVVTANESNSLTYQWYENTQNINHSGTSMPDFVDSTIVVVPQQEGTRYYYVEVVNISDGEKYTATSKAIAVQAVEQTNTPIIVELTETPVQVLPNQEVVLEVKATTVDGVDTNLTYQWYFGGEDNFVGSYKLENETDTKLTVTRSEPGTNYYFVVVTNTVDGSYIVSRSIMVTVLEDAYDEGNADSKANLSGALMDDGNNSNIVWIVVLSSGVLLILFVCAIVLLTKKKSKSNSYYYNNKNYRY